MWFDGQRQPDTVYVASISRGKDSTAMLRAIQILGFPLDMIVAVDIWATKDIPAELPPMVAFKDEYDKKCLERFGIPVTRLCAQKPRSQNVKVERERAEQHTLICSIPNAQQSNMEITSTDSRVQSADVGARNSKQNMLTYEDIFYRTITPQNARKRKQMLDSTPPANLRIPANQRDMVSSIAQKVSTYGFPFVNHPWCNSGLKRAALSNLAAQCTDFQHGGRHGAIRCSKHEYSTILFHDKPANDGRKINIIHYVGIAADEPKRIKRHIDKPNMVLPLVQIGWDEALCGLEAQYMDMLAPTYTDNQLRDGCWFCHNQGIGQLRNLRKNYPELWALLMKWDNDSPVTFRADGHTVHDFDKRFALEDAGLIAPDDRFRWCMIDDDYEYQLKLF